jgi:hypothetical protein
VVRQSMTEEKAVYIRSQEAKGKKEEAMVPQSP